MTTALYEARTLRSRFEEMQRALDRLDSRDTPAGGQAIVLRTKSAGSYPATARSYFACALVELGGVEAEGSAASLGAVAATVYALNVGGKIPPVGTYVVAIVQDGRFGFQYDGVES